MADIELVIKIPEEIRLALINNIQLSPDQQFICDWYIKQAIINGTPLLKGHGRLIDTDDIRVIELEDSLHIIRHEKGDEIDVYIDAPTIIEADKERTDGDD